MIRIFTITLILLLHWTYPGHPQTLGEFPHDPASRGSDGLRLCFYNVENLFDTSDDPVADDDAFLPEGDYHWTYPKYVKKLRNIAKTIIAIGGWEPPALVGIAEIENWQVMYDLCNKTPLQNVGYRIVHDNSPDRRGIDVGIIYRPGKLEALPYRVLPVLLPDSVSYSRDILCAAFRTTNGDTLHVFVNHWPSRYSGAVTTAPFRNAAASTLRAATDSLLRHNGQAKIVIMGDFNDAPGDHSLFHTLGALPAAQAEPPGLVNLMHGLGGGTLYHTQVTGQWYFFDQIIVSTSLVDASGWDVSHGNAFVFEADWLLEKESGRPLRSFRGPVFTGGYSDHLPVYIDLQRSP